MQTVPVSGQFWRILSPRRAATPLSGEGARRMGGRWNRPGVPALYMAGALETAFAEYQQEFQTVRPGTFVAYRVVGATVADLRDDGVLAEIGASPADLHAPWRTSALRGDIPRTWDLSDRLATDVDGILAPSAKHGGGVNLVLWRWNETGGPVVEALDPKNDLTI